MTSILSTKIIRWDITRKCNLACPYCYIPDSSVSDLDTLSIIRILRIACDAGLNELNLSGREPTMRYDLAKIINWCQSRNIKVNIVTNGVRLTRKIMLRILDGLSIISYSIDGADAKVHDRIRGHGNFERAVKNIKDCISCSRKRNPLITIGITCTLTRYNYLNIARMVQFSESLGVDFLAINPVSFCGSAYSSRRSLYLNNDEITRAFNEVCRIYAKLRPNLRLHLGILPKEAQVLNLKYDMDLPVVQDACAAGKTIYITPDGKAYPCYMLPPIAEILINMKKYLRAWHILSEPISIAMQRFKPFLDFVSSHSQKTNLNCLSCDDRDICKPCPLLVEFDENSLRRCADANREIAKLTPHLHDSLIPRFRDGITCNIEHNTATTYMKRIEYENKKIFEIDKTARYMLETIGDSRSIRRIYELMAEKYGHLSAEQIKEQLSNFLIYLWKERILDFQ